MCMCKRCIRMTIFIRCYYCTMLASRWFHICIHIRNRITNCRSLAKCACSCIRIIVSIFCQCSSINIICKIKATCFALNYLKINSFQKFIGYDALFGDIYIVFCNSFFFQICVIYIWNFCSINIGTISTYIPGNNPLCIVIGCRPKLNLCVLTWIIIYISIIIQCPPTF